MTNIAPSRYRQPDALATRQFGGARLFVARCRIRSHNFACSRDFRLFWAIGVSGLQSPLLVPARTCSHLFAPKLLTLLLHLASPVGLLLVSAGSLLYLTAVVSFRSLGWAIAHSSKQLVTTGIYRYSRHPPVRWLELVLLGVSIAGRSGLAVLRSLALLAFFAALVPVEERGLERKFGAHYRECRANTRWVRWPLGRRGSGT